MAAPTTTPADYAAAYVMEPMTAAHWLAVTPMALCIAVGAIRVARENGFLTAKVQLSNITSSNQMMYYRFAWLGDDGFPVGDEESWKTLSLYGSQSTVLPAIAPVPQATDFRIEVQAK